MGLDDPLFVLKLALSELLVDQPANDAVNFSGVAHKRVVRLRLLELFWLRERLVENARAHPVVVERVAPDSADVGVEAAQFAAALRYKALRHLVPVGFGKLADLVIV